jgi:hypothetical protein
VLQIHKATDIILEDITPLSLGDIALQHQSLVYRFNRTPLKNTITRGHYQGHNVHLSVDELTFIKR